MLSYMKTVYAIAWSPSGTGAICVARINEDGSWSCVRGESGGGRRPRELVRELIELLEEAHREEQGVVLVDAASPDSKAVADELRAAGLDARLSENGSARGDKLASSLLGDAIGLVARFVGGVAESNRRNDESR